MTERGEGDKARKPSGPPPRPGRKPPVAKAPQRKPPVRPAPAKEARDEPKGRGDQRARDGGQIINADTVNYYGSDPGSGSYRGYEHEHGESRVVWWVRHHPIKTVLYGAAALVLTSVALHGCGGGAAPVPSGPGTGSGGGTTQPQPVAPPFVACKPDGHGVRWSQTQKIVGHFLGGNQYSLQFAAANSDPTQNACAPQFQVVDEKTKVPVSFQGGTLNCSDGLGPSTNDPTPGYAPIAGLNATCPVGWYIPASHEVSAETDPILFTPTTNTNGGYYDIIAYSNGDPKGVEVARFNIHHSSFGGGSTRTAKAQVRFSRTL